MIKLAAVDDELHALERFENLCAEINDLQVCGLFLNGSELLVYIAQNNVDAIFLDIEMPEQNG